MLHGGAGSGLIGVALFLIRLSALAKKIHQANIAVEQTDQGEKIHHSDESFPSERGAHRFESHLFAPTALLFSSNNLFDCRFEPFRIVFGNSRNFVNTVGDLSDLYVFFSEPSAELLFAFVAVSAPWSFAADSAATLSRSCPASMINSSITSSKLILSTS